MQNFTPKRTKNNRKVISEEVKIFCGKPTPDGEEYGSAGLVSIMQAIVKACDECGVPANVAIKFYLAQNRKLMSLDVPILPTIVEMNKNNSHFVQIYVNCEDDTDVRSKTKEATKTREAKAKFKTAADDNAYNAVLYIQRELALKCLELKAKESKTQDDVELIRVLENLTLVKPLSLASVKKPNVGFKLVKGLDYREEDSRAADYEAARDYSIKFQQEHAGTSDVELVLISENQSIIGLNKGKTPEEIAYYAELDARANQAKFDKEVLDESIVSNYCTTKKIGKPKNFGEN